MRSLKYGKLQNGQFLSVPPALIRRLKQHFVTLPCGVEAILGNNGHIWLTVPAPEDPEALAQAEQGEATPLAEVLVRRRKLHAEKRIMSDERERICRVYNAITVLSILYISIHPGSIMAIYDKSFSDGLEAKEVLHPQQLPGFIDAVAAAAADESSRR
jgi:exosome complex component RRP4